MIFMASLSFKLFNGLYDTIVEMDERTTKGREMDTGSIAGFMLLFGIVFVLWTGNRAVDEMLEGKHS